MDRGVAPHLFRMSYKLPKRIPAYLTDMGLSRRVRILRDIAESQGWRLFRGGGDEPWGIRCLKRPDAVRRGRNLDEITQKICDIHLPPWKNIKALDG